MSATRQDPAEASKANPRIRGRAAARGVLAAVYLAAGVFHLYLPDPFVLITPDWVPFPRQVILGTGLCEIAGALALLTPRLRRAAGVALALYAVCVFPANVKHFIDGVPAAGVQLGWWYHLPRLAFQPVFVWWALFAGEVVSWPFGKTPPRRRPPVA
jgi:uncharacterized membrane protein